MACKLLGRSGAVGAQGRSEPADQFAQDLHCVPIMLRRCRLLSKAQGDNKRHPARHSFRVEHG